MNKCYKLCNAPSVGKFSLFGTVNPAYIDNNVLSKFRYRSYCYELIVTDIYTSHTCSYWSHQHTVERYNWTVTEFPIILCCAALRCDLTLAF